MLITGIKTKEIEGDKNLECLNCMRPDVEIRGILKYLHIFWIPMFTVRKKLVLNCSHCNKELKKRDIGKSQYRDIKKSIFLPSIVLSRNFGLIVIGITFLITNIMAFAGALKELP